MPSQKLYIGNAYETDEEGEGVGIHQIADQLIRRRCLGIMEYHKDANDEASDDEESEVTADLAWSRPIGGKAVCTTSLSWAYTLEGQMDALSCLVFSEPLRGEISVSSLKVGFKEDHRLVDHFRIRLVLSDSPLRIKTRIDPTWKREGRRVRPSHRVYSRLRQIPRPQQTQVWLTGQLIHPLWILLSLKYRYRSNSGVSKASESQWMNLAHQGLTERIRSIP